MLKGQVDVKSIYVESEWEVVEEEFKIENNFKNETIFSVGNGFLGLRGNFEEMLKGPKGMGLEGTYINGFYETEPIKYGEIAYGFAENSQTMLNVTNGKIIRLFIGDEEFNMLEGTITNYRRVLNMREGLLSRSLTWKSPKGKTVNIRIERMVSMDSKHTAVIRYEICPTDFNGKIRILSQLDGDVRNLTVENDPRVGSGLTGPALHVQSKKSGKGYLEIIQKTKNSGFVIVAAAGHNLETKSPFVSKNVEDQLSVSVEYEIDAEINQPVCLEKYLVYATTKDFREEELSTFAADAVAKVEKDGYAEMKRRQKEYLNNFWYKADIMVKGEADIQQGIRFNIFQLLQSVGKDGKTNIGAKGLTGEGYEGHYFWDSEMFVVPFFLYHHPEISRKMLEYRYNTLDFARERARQMSHPKGALFPWRTIGGEECSAYFPAGTAQYHINADISYAIKSYIEVTEDEEFLVTCGAEILFETARVWADMGSFIPAKGNRFCINCVTGPDEYTALVNNNCYTNMIARVNLQYAYDTALLMKNKYPKEYESLQKKIGLAEEEISFWKKAADKMYIPYDKKSGLYLQDDAFLDRAPWDFEKTPPENYPLLIHYHPMVIYRHQVCKQADLVLALYLLGENFTLQEKKKNYDFYEKLTTHDSSLSTCIFSMVAAEVGYHEKAYEYFMNTVRMDLDDYHHNTHNGIHAANMAGTWMCMVHGFAGMRVQGHTLSFKPYLPGKWDGYSFRVNFKGSLIEVDVEKDGTKYRLISGNQISILHNGKKMTLEKQ